MSDGASALVLASGEAVEKHNLQPIGRVIGWGEAEQAPIKFTTAPSKAIPVALQHAGLKQDQVDFWEINEAFSVVALANLRLLNLDPETVNIYGGAVSMGHPLGSSGSRIIATLLTVLKNQGGKYGVAALCNGGGGASAFVVERL